MLTLYINKEMNVDKGGEQLTTSERNLFWLNFRTEKCEFPCIKSFSNFQSKVVKYSRICTFNFEYRPLYMIRRFHTANNNARYWTQSWTSSVHFPPSQLTSSPSYTFSLLYYLSASLQASQFQTLCNKIWRSVHTSCTSAISLQPDVFIYVGVSELFNDADAYWDDITSVTDKCTDKWVN